MSGRGGYSNGNGYGYPETSRFDDGRYGSSDSLGVNGYGGRGGGSSGSNGGSRDRRPGGYGGFYAESSQSSSISPGQSPERRRDMSDRERQQPSSQSTSRSRPRDGGSDRRYQSAREDRSTEEARYADNRSHDRLVPEMGSAVSNTGGKQTVEGLLLLIPALL